MKKCTILVLIAAGLNICLALDLPPDFMKCNRSAANLDDCMIDAIKDTMIRLEKGLSEFNFPPLDVIKVPSITIEEGKGTVNVAQKYKDVEVRKLSRPRFDKVKTIATDTDFKLEMDLFNDEMIMSGKYDFNGKILILPISGKGNFKFNLSNVKVKVIFTGSSVEKKGKTYMEISDCNVKIEPGKVTFLLENLFNGDERLGKEMIAVMNENWKDVYYDVNPGYEKVFNAVLKNLINLVFKKVPYDVLFLH